MVARNVSLHLHLFINLYLPDFLVYKSNLKRQFPGIRLVSSLFCVLVSMNFYIITSVIITSVF